MAVPGYWCSAAARVRLTEANRVQEAGEQTILATSSCYRSGAATAASSFGGDFCSHCGGGGGMTALAGSIPRMMRPTLAQNYPRSGFPLEGRASLCLKERLLP